MNLVSVFQELKCIYGFCPCCGEVFRLSDATIFTRLQPQKTDFDKLADRQRRLDRSVEAFDLREDNIRDAARRKGQAAAKARLKSLVPVFAKRQIDPNDVKVLFDPVQYVVFRGLSDEKCSSLEFIDPPPASPAQERVHESLTLAIKRGNIEWQTLRIDQLGNVVAEARSRRA